LPGHRNFTDAGRSISPQFGSAMHGRANVPEHSTSILISPHIKLFTARWDTALRACPPGQLAKNEDMLT